MESVRSRFFVVAACLILARSASAAPHGVFWSQQRQREHRIFPSANARLVYYGGPVISNAKVYAVFWGDGVAAETQSRIGAFFTNILDSTYMDWLSEYDTGIVAVDGRRGTNQKIGRGTFAGEVAIKPAQTSRELTDAMIQRELEAQIAAGQLPAPDENSLYMLYFPRGVSVSVDSMRSCSDFCAYHEGFKSQAGASVFYGVMPVCGFGCDFGSSAFDALTVVSSHEALEAVTDPFPTPADRPAYPQAWNTTSGEEIGDLCVAGRSTVAGNGVVSAVQQQWDNSAGACAAGPWSR